jgi:hypothetical protein
MSSFLLHNWKQWDDKDLDMMLASTQAMRSNTTGLF